MLYLPTVISNGSWRYSKMLTDEQLQEIESFAYRYMLIGEIALITGVDAAQLADPDGPAGQAFLRGRLKRKAEFHESLIQLSKQLSSPAMVIENRSEEHPSALQSPMRL